MEMLGTDTKTTLFVGDQIFTDIIGANLTGIRSILVAPIDPHEEMCIRDSCSILHGLGKAKQVLFVNLLTCAIRILMIMLLVPHYGIDAYPVSYTHLDVYKRQI